MGVDLRSALSSFPRKRESRFPGFADCTIVQLDCRFRGNDDGVVDCEVTGEGDQ